MPSYQAPSADIAPPVTQNSRDVVQAGMDLRRAELMKKNIRSTVHAGETGGFSPYGNGNKPRSPFTAPVPTSGAFVSPYNNGPK